MKWQIWLLLVPLETIVARPVHQSFQASNVDHIPQVAGISPLHHELAASPTELSHQSHESSEKGKVIDAILEKISKEITEEQTQEIRSKYLKSASFRDALGRPLAHRIKVEVGEVDPTAIGKNNAAKYYQDFAVKVGAFTKEEIDQRMKENKSRHYARYSRSRSINSTSEASQSRLLHKQREAYANGKSMMNALGRKTTKMIKQDLQNLKPTTNLQLADYQAHAQAYAIQNNIIDDEVLSRRKIAMERKVLSVSERKDKKGKSPAAPVERRGGLDVVLRSEDGQGMKIRLRSSMKKMQQLYSDGKYLSRVLGAEVSEQIRIKRRLAGHETTPAEMEGYLTKIAAQIGLATKEDIARRRKIVARNGYRARSEKLKTKKQKSEIGEGSSGKRLRKSSTEAVNQNRHKNLGSPRRPPKDMLALPNLSSVGTSHGKTAPSPTDHSSQVATDHSTLHRPGSVSPDTPRTTHLPFPLHDTSLAHDMLVKDREPEVRHDISSSAFPSQSDSLPAHNIFDMDHPHDSRHDSDHSLFSSTFTSHTPFENHWEPGHHHFVYHPQPGSPQFAGDVILPHENHDWQH